VGLRVLKVVLSVSPEGVICAFGLGEAASDDRPIGEYLIIEDSHDAYLAYTRALRAFSGATLVGSLWSTGGGHSQRQLQEGVGEKRPSLGFWKVLDPDG
jgi:hypothetical protein